MKVDEYGNFYVTDRLKEVSHAPRWKGLVLIQQPR
jgi:hypothetical protein